MKCFHTAPRPVIDMLTQCGSPSDCPTFAIFIAPTVLRKLLAILVKDEHSSVQKISGLQFFISNGLVPLFLRAERLACFSSETMSPAVVVGTLVHASIHDVQHALHQSQDQRIEHN